MRRRLVLLVAVVLVAASCSQRPSEEASKQKPSAPVVAGSSILDFEAPKLGGGQVVGSEFANKDVAIWVWAPW